MKRLLLCFVLVCCAQSSLAQTVAQGPGNSIVSPWRVTFGGTAQPVTFNGVAQPITFTMPSLVAGSALIGHVITDTGSTTAITGNVTVVQSTGSNLHAVIDSITNAVTVTSSTASNLPSVATQGPAASLANAWSTRLTDTSNGPVAVKASGVAVLGTDAALVVALSPNSTKLLVTPDSVALPANQSVNLAQVTGTATSVNSGTKDAGTQRVIIATDQPALTNKLLVTPDSVALPANQSVNVNQLAGTATSVNSGTKDAGTLRVVLATDQPALTNKLLVTPDSVALPANQSVNVNQFGGSAVTTGVGAGGVGIPRVTLSNDSVLAANQSVNLAQVAGATTSTAASGVIKVGVTGNAGAAVDAANNAAMPANALSAGAQTATIDASPTAATAGNLRYILESTEGVLYVQEGGPKRFSCFVQAVTATTQCQAAPAAGFRAYVTSVTMSNQAATVQTIDIVYGTGAACVTGTTALTHKWQLGTNATTTSPYDVSVSFTTPLVPVAANAICVRPSAATAFGVTLTGYVAP